MRKFGLKKAASCVTPPSDKPTSVCLIARGPTPQCPREEQSEQEKITKKMNGNSLTRNEKEKKKQRNHDEEEEEEAQVGVPRLQDILHRTGPTAFSI